MKLSSALFAAIVFAFASFAHAQTAPLLKRTTYKTDAFDFRAGGTVAVTGAPRGSIRIEGWNSNQIQINAEIEVSARTEAELDELSRLTGFTLQEGTSRVDITSTGTHDRDFLKRSGEKLSKEIAGLPFRIDYVIKVPRYCDLQIDGGKGELYVGSVDGMLKINYLEADAKLDLIGGAVFATFGGGRVSVSIPNRNWRGRLADVSLASGTMDVQLPPSLNAELDASILRTGSITNSYAELKPKNRRDAFTEKLIAARAGAGGVPLKFTVGDGTLNISEFKQP